MQQQISINLTHSELTSIIYSAVHAAINERLQPTCNDELMTIEQASQYLKCSSVFLWKKRKEGRIKAVNAGKKILFPKSSLDSFLQLKAHK